MRVLAVNAGSSSLKLTLLGPVDETLGAWELTLTDSGVDERQLRDALDQRLAGADAIGHRVVHGGERFRDAVVIDADVRVQLQALTELAPLHQPKSLAALAAVSAMYPATPAVACFDTAFHAGLPAAARTYALPGPWRDRWPLRRFGFHGLSHAWVARRVPDLLRRPAANLRIVSCHLGAGASLCAIADGRSIDTTMGFTPLEGLVMATRSGSVDPGLVLWMLERSGLSQRELAFALEHESGLQGLAGSSDMRAVLERAATRDERARLAVDVYLHRLRSGIGAMAAVLGGLDALVFTGGVGENAAEIRHAAVEGLGFLGLALDAEVNSRQRGDGDISRRDAPARTLVVQAREDREIARQVRARLDV